MKAALKNVVKSLRFHAASHPKAIKRRLTYLSERHAIVVLNLHRVSPADGSAYPPLCPELFDDLLAFCTDRFDVKTFTELETVSNRPQLVLSFDDGYRDFYEFAMPTLEKYEVRVNHNLVPNCIETGLPPLNVMAQDFIGKASSGSLEKLDVPGFDASITRASALKLSAFIKFKPQADRDILARHLVPQFQADANFSPTPMMNASQIRNIIEQHEVGVHSFSHASMDTETDDYVQQDAIRSKAYFQTRFETDVKIYAFPNGRYRTNHLDILRSEGFEILLLVGGQINPPDAVGTGVFKRTTFDASSQAELVFRGMGAGAKIA